MLFSRRDLAKIILPLLLQQILALAVGTVDSMMVAHAGEAAVSAVALVTSLDAVLIRVFNSLINGGAVVVAQTLGTKKPETARDAAKQLFWSTMAISVLLTVAVLLFRDPLLNAVFGDVEPDVMQHARGYFLFIVLSFPATALFNITDVLFRTMGDSMTSLVASLCMNVAHLGLNALLIVGFGMGAVGAGISTMVCRLLCSLVLTVLLHNPKHAVCFRNLLQYKPDFRIIRSILRIGIPNGVESGMVDVGRLILQALVAPMGTAVIAANSVANTLVNYQYAAGYAYQNAAVTIVGRCIGAGEREQAKQYAKKLLLLNYITLWGVVVGSAFLARNFIGAYELSQEASETAYQLILFHCVFASVLWPLGFTMPVIFRAAGDVKVPLLVSTVAMWVLRVGLGSVFALPSFTVLGITVPGLGLGVMGTWMGMTADWILRAGVYAGHFLTDRWLPKHMRTSAMPAKDRPVCALK